MHSCTIMVQLKLHPLPICPPMPTLLSYPTCPLTTPNPQPPLLAAAPSGRLVAKRVLPARASRHARGIWRH